MILYQSITLLSYVKLHSVHYFLSVSERLLAQQNPLSQADRPHQLFADAPPTSQPSTSGPSSGPPGAPPPPSGGKYTLLHYILLRLQPFFSQEITP